MSNGYFFDLELNVRHVAGLRERTLILRGVGWSLEGEGHIDIFRATGRVRVEMSGYWGGSH